jgi:hypothetical protein
VIRRTVILILAMLTAAPWGGSALEFSQIETRHFTIRFGPGAAAGVIDETAGAFETAYGKMETVLGGAGTRPIDVVIFDETGDFTAETTLPVWSASATIGGAIYMQPIRVLVARGVLATTIAHEVCLVFLLRRYGAGIPVWLAEGLAVYHSGEFETLRRGLSGTQPPIAGPADIDALLLDRDDKQANRWGYVLAYEAVRSMVEGRPKAQSRKGGAP